MNVGSVAVGIDSPMPPGPPLDPTINFNFTLPGAGAGKGCLLAPGESCTKDLSIAPVTIGPAQARFESAYGASDGRTGLEYIYVTANGVASGPLVVYRDMYPCPTGVGMCWGRVSGSGLLAGDPVLGGYIQSNQAGELPIGTVAPDGTFDGALDAHCGSTLQTYAHSHLADGTAITSNRAAAPC